MDFYSKLVLTVIAAALCGLCLQNAGVLPANADNNSVSKVQICGLDEQGNTSCAGVSNPFGTTFPTMQGSLFSKSRQ